MSKYLIFRTDKIGDFLLTAILIKSIKRNDPKSKIIVIGSKNNFSYIKSFNFIDDVFLLKRGLLNKFCLIYKLYKNHYNAIINHDGKNRSSFISFFLRSNIKISSKNNFKYSHFEDILKILNILNFKFYESDLNTIENKNYTNSITLNFDYSVLHFDEKWIYSMYIKNYKNIEPSKNELIDFFNLIISKTNKKLIITTGITSPKILTEIFTYNSNANLIFYKNLNIFELEEIIVKSKLLISCHGSVSHMASAKNIKQIDIIDENKINPYWKWTKHFRNYLPIYRKNFSELSKEIISFL
tara:strand:- start:667 stop:1560 length:894 start_codon:yes stop_codon:yes gene_type:complete